MYFDAFFLDKLLYFYTNTRYTMTVIGRDNLCIGFGTALCQKRNPSKKKGITKMIIKNYRDNKELRQSFNELARQTFDIDFEDWYQNGFWSDGYRPYSIVLNGKVAANVSVSHMNFIRHGQRKFYIQLGTVMTDKAYRNRGFIRQIMAEIEKDYRMRTDGVYLFANDSVLDFYPKFGFRKADEYQYSGKIIAETSSIPISDKERSFGKEPVIEQIPMRDKTAWTLLEQAVRRSVPQSAFEMTDNSGLIMFYVTKYMRENVFYHKELDAYVIAETENDRLLLHNIFAPHPVDIMQIVNDWGGNIRQVILGFTPQNHGALTLALRKEDDCTLFLKGSGFERFEMDRMMFPTLSHA